MHLGLWKEESADLGGHLVAKRAAKSQHERPETEIWSKLRFSDGFLLVFLSMGLPCRGSSEAIFGAKQAIPGVSGAILGSLLVFGRPCWEAMRGTLGLGRAMLQILEAILWPRGLPRANMSDQKQRFGQNYDFLMVFCWFFCRWACLAEAALRLFSGQSRPSQGSQEPFWDHFWCLEGHVGRL